MVKLVEEFKIDSEVLANALVKAGVVDETFTDGNAYRIDCEYGYNGVNTYTIKVEKEISLKELVGTDDAGRPIYKENTEAVTSGVGNLTGTPYVKLTKLQDLETILSKEDTEKLLNNINVSDKLTTNIANILNNAWDINKDSLNGSNDEESNEVDERDDLDKIVDLLAYLKESVDTLNNDKFNAENFAQTFIERINNMKGVKVGF